MSYASAPATLQEALERATAANPGGRGGGLLMVTTPGHPPEAYVAGRRGGTGGGALTPETPYGLASITKTFVATLTLIYAERGLIDLDAPALRLAGDAGWLLKVIDNRDFRHNLEAATLRDLLSHRSGLPDYWDSRAFYQTWRRQEGKQWGHLEVLEWAGRRSPVCEVGHCFRYADTNYVILGLLLERRFGKELHQLLREEIFAPLDMDCTWMFFEETAPAGCGPVAHSYEGRLDVTAGRLQSADWAGGGLYSTLADQARFLDALFLRHSLISDASLEEMTHWRHSNLGRGISYGLGLYKVEAGNGRTLIGHIGVHSAFSFLWLETGILFTGSLNQENNNVRRRLLHPAMEMLERSGEPSDNP